MVAISIVNLKIVQREDNLSSLFYRKEILDALDVLDTYIAKKGGFSLNNQYFIKKIETRTFHTYSSAYYTTSDKGYPLVQVSTLNDCFLKFEKYISRNFEDKFRGKFLFPKGSIFISRGGTLGLVGINYEHKYCSISQDVIGIYPNESKIKPEVLFAFFLSKYGQAVLHLCTMGAVQPHLELSKLKEKIVPLFCKEFQFYIEQLIKQAYEKRKLAEQKYQQAEEILYELLGISKEDIERLEAEKAYETNFKEVKQAFRFDAEYYRPKYSISDKIFKQIPSERLGSKEYFELKKGIEVGSDAYCDENRGVLFLRVSNLSRNGLKLNPSDKYIFKGVYEKLRPEYEPKEGEVLFSKDGTIGTATVVDSGFPPFIISGGVVRIIIKKDFDPYYLAFALNSILSKLQVTREKTGTVIEHLRFSKLKEIKVPKLPLSQQQEIANLVKEYFKLRKEARQLIQRAIREVEEAIENASRSNGE